MTEQTGTGPATAELDAWLAEQKADGLIEFAAYPGSDREIGHEEASRVIMAMIRAADEAPDVIDEI